MGNIKLLNCDCMSYMANLLDKEFDLAIVDPPYGIGMGCGAGETRGDGKKKKDLYVPKDWDYCKPSDDYWAELMRVSNNQIIWGGNYFSSSLPESRGWIYWRKLMGGNYSDGELAWTSFDRVLKEFTQRSEQGAKRFHPTQKPVALYQWLLKNYATPGDRILDTHGGSCSLAIACDIMVFDAVICEIDKDYYDAAVERFNRHKQQQVLDFGGCVDGKGCAQN